MKIFGIIMGIILAVILLILFITYICFYLAFYVPNRKKKDSEEFKIPSGKIYEPYREKMIQWMKDMRNAPHEEITIESFDGLKLYGRYYEHEPGAPIELMFHGYRGTSERDLCGGMHRCFALGRNSLIVDQRASGKSEGNIISFGINERRDCLSWIEYMNSKFGNDVEIILTGISMGAATVMLAGGMKLPENVSWILADCGYTSAKDIIKKVIRQMKLPADLLYPFVKLGAKIYGHFDLEEASPNEAMKKCKKPVIFFHGEHDDFVPCEMSRINHEACVAPKRLVTIPDAGHGLCFMVDKDKYYKVLEEFSGQYGLKERKH